MLMIDTHMHGGSGVKRQVQKVWVGKQKFYQQIEEARRGP